MGKGVKGEGEKGQSIQYAPLPTSPPPTCMLMECQGMALTWRPLSQVPWAPEPVEKLECRGSEARRRECAGRAGQAASICERREGKEEKGDEEGGDRGEWGRKG
jgi:hypothetical protein